jgi:hypothetical protein
MRSMKFSSGRYQRSAQSHDNRRKRQEILQPLEILPVALKMRAECLPNRCHRANNSVVATQDLTLRLFPLTSDPEKLVEFGKSDTQAFSFSCLRLLRGFE